MSEALQRTEPVSTVGFIGEGVTIGFAEPMSRYSLRARQAQTLEALLGAKVPLAIGETKGGIQGILYVGQVHPQAPCISK